MVTLFLQILRLSLWGSLLTPVILLAKRLAGERLSAGFHYMVWGVLLLRLVLPFSLTWQQPVPVEASALPPVTGQRAALPQAELPETAAGAAEAAPAAAGTAEPPGAGQPLHFGEMVRSLAAWGYWLGAAVYAAVMLASAIHARRELLPEQAVPAISTLFAEERARLRAPRRTRLRFSASGSPYASGVLRPCVTLPFPPAENPGELRAVLRHELTHIRYGDTLLCVLLVVLQGLHWFNPVLWYAFWCIRRDGEFACDERALRQCSPEERLIYGRALLHVAERVSVPSLYSTFAVRPLQQRMRKIITARPAWRWEKPVTALLLLACAAFGAAVGARKIEVPTVDASSLTADEVWRWNGVDYPLLAELPGEELALYALDPALRENDGDASYSGRVVLRQGEQTQIFAWDDIYSASRYPALAAGDYDGDGRREYACISFGPHLTGEFDGRLRLLRPDADGHWDDTLSLTGSAAAEAIARQFSAGGVVAGRLTFTVNGEPQEIELPDDLRGKTLLRLAVLPYVRFHAEETLSVSAAISAYFDEHPVFAGYLNAPLRLSGDTLTIGSAVFAGSLFRDYPANWLRLSDAETGLTLGLPPYWEGNFINRAPHNDSGGYCPFDLYERYNYSLPPSYDDVHFGFLIDFYEGSADEEDYQNFLGYHNGRAYFFQYPHGVEFDEYDRDACGHYQPLNFDEQRIVAGFVVANHLSVKGCTYYWDMMQPPGAAQADPFGDPQTETAAPSLDQLGLLRSGVPVFLPDALPASGPQIPDELKHYFTASIADGVYQVEILDLSGYQGDDPYHDAPNLPLSFRQGALYGIRGDGAGWLPETTVDPSAAAREGELIPGIAARYYDDDTLICWEQNGWSFRFNGNSGRWLDLRNFAALWKNITPISPTGRVEIYDRSTYFIWESQGCTYAYEAYQMDFPSALNVFASMRQTGY